MLTTLLDHSTISAVERLSGVVPVKNSYLIDADIVALEAFVQAHLFYDQIVVLDDYKAEHTEGRKSRFSQFLWLDTHLFNYQGMVEDARKEIESYNLSVKKNGKISGEFGEILQLLFNNIAFTWRMASSTFWLKISMLGARDDAAIHRYSKTWEGLLNALRDLERVNSVDAPLNDLANRLVGSFETPPVGDAAIASETRTFFAALAWLSQRTVLYSKIAHSNGIDTTLHPIRNTFSAQYLGRLGLPRETIPALIRTVAEEHSDAAEKIESMKGGGFAALEIPFFSAFLASKGIPVSRYGEVLPELRNEPALKEWRSRLAELKVSAERGDSDRATIEIRAALQKLHRDKDKMLQKFGVQTPQGISSQNVIALANAGLVSAGVPAVIPRVDWKIPVPGFIQKISDGFGQSLLLSSWVSSVTRVERLGGLRTRLGAEVDKQGKFFARPVEDEVYIGRDSSVRHWAKTHSGG